MKLCLYTDNHFCEKASIISKQGNKFSVRLENQIKSVEWTEEIADKYNCEYSICLGDFFDKHTLTDQEIEAFHAINWSKNHKHIFIVGNHESHVEGLYWSSARMLTFAGQVFHEPTQIDNLCFLPYITEDARRPISEYFAYNGKKNIIFSHNDIAGIQMGTIISKSGFTIDEIESYDSCSLFLNGHLHNGKKISNKITNLGNLTGKDFGENAELYSHGVFILDTETLKMEFIENPYAFNFYQLDINTETDFLKFNSLKNNSVVSIKCRLPLVQMVKERLLKITNIFNSRIITTLDPSDLTNPELNVDDLSQTDYLEKYKELCHAKIENSSILDYEIAEVCK